MQALRNKLREQLKAAGIVRRGINVDFGVCDLIGILDQVDRILGKGCIAHSTFDVTTNKKKENLRKEFVDSMKDYQHETIEVAIKEESGQVLKEKDPKHLGKLVESCIVREIRDRNEHLKTKKRKATKKKNDECKGIAKDAVILLESLGLTPVEIEFPVGGKNTVRMGDGSYLSGRIDLLMRNEQEEYVIVDIKTRRYQNSPRVSLRDMVQIHAYALLFQMVHGGTVGGMAFLYVYPFSGKLGMTWMSFNPAVLSHPIIRQKTLSFIPEGVHLDEIEVLRRSVGVIEVSESESEPDDDAEVEKSAKETLDGSKAAASDTALGNTDGAKGSKESSEDSSGKSSGEK